MINRRVNLPNFHFQSRWLNDAKDGVSQPLQLNIFLSI